MKRRILNSIITAVLVVVAILIPAHVVFAQSGSGTVTV